MHTTFAEYQLAKANSIEKHQLKQAGAYNKVNYVALAALVFLSAFAVWVVTINVFAL